MLVAGVLGRAELADSARRVLESARPDRHTDPRGEMRAMEALVRVWLGDHDEAIGLLQRYLTANPEHREGFVKANTWWWRPLENDPRFRRLVGSS